MNMNKFIRLSTTALLVVLMTAMTGCVTKTDFETLQMQRAQDLNRIKQLEGELQETKQLLSQEIESSQNPVRQRTADIYAEVQGMRKDLATLRGELDAVESRMDRQIGTTESELTLMTLKEEIDEIEFILENQLQVDIDQVHIENASTKPVAEAAVPASSAEVATGVVAGEAAAAPAPTSDTDPAKALYDKAYALYKDGQYEKARSYWAEFTATFKGHPFTPSAVFWQGQCYYKLKDYARAAILFEDVIEKHQKSSKYKSALLKAGYSWNYLKKPELAKMRMEEVVKKFPKSVEATQAKRYLNKVK